MSNYCSSIRESVAAIAILRGIKKPSFTSFDLGLLPLPKGVQIHGNAKSYFASCVPKRSVDPGFHMLCSPELVQWENTKGIPGVYLCPQGFVVFGSDPNGDGIVMDLRTAEVFVFSHEILSEEGIDVWNGKSSKTRSYTPENVRSSSSKRYSDLHKFLSEWKQVVKRAVEEEEAFERESFLSPHAVDKWGNTKLMRMIALDDLRGVKRELKRGANLGHKNSEGSTAVTKAVIHQRPDILKYLIKCGANVNEFDGAGRTPLMWSAHYSTIECMRILLNAGANADAKDAIGWTALKYLCPVHGTPEMKALLEEFMTDSAV